jgi:CheY-like chemotaxis protein
MNKETNILLVDDDVDEQEAFTSALQKLDAPINLFFAKDAIGLFNLLATDTYIHLIFLDINMPVKDGKKCLRELKSIPSYQHIPVLVYTVSQSIEDINEVFECGAHYYAIKPYAEINFIETLKTIFNIDWTVQQPIPPRDQFVINMAFI